MEFNELMKYLHWPLIGLAVYGIHSFERSLTSLAKRKLKRGTLLRRIILLDEANDPDEVIPRER